MGFGFLGILVIEDFVTVLAFFAMILAYAIDWSNVGVHMGLMCLHTFRGFLMVALVCGPEEGRVLWPALPTLTGAMALSCAFIKFEEPFTYVAWILLGTSILSFFITIIAGHMIKDTAPDEVVGESRGVSTMQLAMMFRKREKALSALDMLTGRAASAQDLDIEAQSTCMICLSEFDRDNQLVEMKCGHIYHEECIRTWFSKGSITCPLRCALGKYMVVVEESADLVEV